MSLFSCDLNSAFLPLHDGHILTTNSPDSVIVHVPNNVLDELRVSAVASRHVIESDWIVEDSPKSGVVTSQDEGAII